MFISIDAFRFFDKAAQIFLHWMKNSLVSSHIFFFKVVLPNLIHVRVFISHSLHLFWH